MARKPPCPDPDSFIWVTSREGGGFWRRKRGMVKPAVLNSYFERNAEITAHINACGKRIMTCLAPYLVRLDTGRFYSMLTGKLKQGYNKTGQTDYRLLKGMDLQPRHRLERLMSTGYSVKKGDEMVEVEIDVFEGAVKKNTPLTTHYFFELVLVQGDAGKENDLRADSEMSVVYVFDELDERTITCKLRVHPRSKPWMALLKLSCIETATASILEMARSPRNYGMKVVATG